MQTKVDTQPCFFCSFSAAMRYAGVSKTLQQYWGGHTCLRSSFLRAISAALSSLEMWFVGMATGDTARLPKGSVWILSEGVGARKGGDCKCGDAVL